METSVGATILVVDDDSGFLGLLTEMLASEGYRVLSAGTLREAMESLGREAVDLVLLDVHLPDGNGLFFIPRVKSMALSPEVIIITGFGDPDGAGLALRNGAWDYVEKSYDPDRIKLPILRALQYREARRSKAAGPLFGRFGIGGQGRQISACLDFAARVAPTDATVLIRGETGTGKELFARAIHENSRRRQGPFVVVDCGALSPTLAESILFGHSRGAFTGAERAHQGLVGEAHGGTLFLDEVAELPVDMQAVFLRVLQERRYRPLGGKGELESDFRLLAATNRDLEAMEKAGTFRSDLLFRLGVAVLRLPPLRECREDMTELALTHLSRLCDRYGIPMKGISPDFLEALFSYDWPGNVRELFHVLERALVEARDETLLFSRDLPVELRLKAIASHEEKGQATPASAPDLFPGDDAAIPSLQEVRDRAVGHAERRYLEDLLRRVGGDMKQAVALSGLSRSQFYRLMGKHGIRRKNSP